MASPLSGAVRFVRVVLKGGPSSHYSSKVRTLRVKHSLASSEQRRDPDRSTHSTYPTALWQTTSGLVLLLLPVLLKVTRYGAKSSSGQVSDGGAIN